MLKFKDILFFLFITISFFVLLIFFNYIGFIESINLFLTSFLYGIVNSMYASQLKYEKVYLLLTVPFLVLILFLGKSNEIFLICSGIFMATSLIFMSRNLKIFSNFTKTE